MGDARLPGLNRPLCVGCVMLAVAVIGARCQPVEEASPQRKPQYETSSIRLDASGRHGTGLRHAECLCGGTILPAAGTGCHDGAAAAPGRIRRAATRCRLRLDHRFLGVGNGPSRVGGWALVCPQAGVPLGASHLATRGAWLASARRLLGSPLSLSDPRAGLQHRPWSG